MSKFLYSNICFWTQDYSEAPSSVLLEFTDEEIERIKKLQAIAAENDVSIRMDFCANEYFQDADKDDDSGFVKTVPCTNWKVGYECLTIYAGKIFYYAQSSYDSRDQIECEGFTIEQIENSTVKP